jgi:tripeptidyl-peptidase I
VSALTLVRIIENGGTTGAIGTSISAPIFASILALINDALVSTGKSLPGYINKTLYLTAVRSAFTDITSGMIFLHTLV